MSKVELTEGQDAPDFKLESTEGTVELSTAVANAQNGVVVYFYPKASTPGVYNGSLRLQRLITIPEIRRLHRDCH